MHKRRPLAFGDRTGRRGGTAPLWAGFTALINEKCGADGRPRVGFNNPALYSIGIAGGAPFHDVTTGNSAWSTNIFYYAASGYDLCTPPHQSLAANTVFTKSLPYMERRI